MLEETQDHSVICLTCKNPFPHGTQTCPDDGGKLYPPQVCKIVGTIFAERYEILEPVGEGGMSVVYKARHIHMQRIVAIKLLHERIATDEKALMRFKREAQATGNLSHQNIISVFDFGVTKDHQAFFVMDFLDGEPLDVVIRRDRSVAPSRAVNIFKQICDGLEHAHKKGIVHRDLKPSNIILVKQDDGTEVVKIVDFGIAKMVAVDKATKQQLTQTGQVVGSPLYLSPEQCEGAATDDRSDIYSLGCLMFETLAGSPPFMGDSVISTMVKHMSDPAPLFTDLIPNARIPQPIEYVVRKCLEKNASDRYQTVGELRQSLLDAAAASSLEGYRTGGVMEVSKSQAGLAKTWDKLVANMPGLKPAQKAGHSWPLIVGLAIPGVILVVSLAISLLWSGPEDDKGTIWDKTVWQFMMGSAERTAERGDYAQALAEIGKCQALANTFGDGHGRLLKTLKLKSQILGSASMFEEQEKVNDAIVKTQLAQIMAEVNDSQALLRRLAQATSSPVSLERARLEAVANSGKILLSSRRLYSRGMYDEDETFLRQALDTYQKLGLQQSQTVASFKTQLADCLIKQQALDSVRPLLAAALEIRRAAPDQNARTVKRQIVESLLRLGQFDRDQSNFKDSKIELVEALSLVRKDFATDRALTKECLQSYADLLRQTGEIEGSKKLLQEAGKLPSAPLGAGDQPTE